MSGTKRYTFKTMSPEWRNYEAWPTVDVSGCDIDTRHRYERMSLGVKSYLTDGRLKAACVEAKCSGSVLLDVVNRCIQPGPDKIGRVGWVGCIGGVRISSYTRTKLTVGNAPTGKAGSFRQFLLNHRSAHKYLDDLIRAGGGKRTAKGSHPQVRAVAKMFRAWCFEHGGLSPMDYPFNGELEGIRSIERYIKKFVESDPRASLVWLGPDYAHHSGLGTGLKAFSFTNEVGDTVAMDSYRIDCFGSVRIMTPHGPQNVVVKRPWLHVCVDEETRCILGYCVSISSQITASSIVDALSCLVMPWEPRQLNFGEADYLPGAGLPVGVIPGLTELRPACIKADNAMQHYATAYLEDARRRLGCSLTWGPVGKWWHNAIVERIINMLALNGFQKLPSSTGSNPADPLKPDSINQSLKQRITIDDLLDFIDTLIANHNASAKSPQGGQSPLAALENRMNGYHRHRPLLRPSVPPTLHQPRLGIVVETKSVCGSFKKGQVRTPYVQIDEVRYGSPKLAERFDLRREKIIVHIDEHDLRTVRAFLLSGQEIGELVCLDKRWAETRHDRQLRKAICAAICKGKVSQNASDFVHAWVQHLHERTVAHARKSPNKVSADATNLAQAIHKTGVSPESLLHEMSMPVSAVPDRPIPKNLPPPDWTNL